MPCSQQGSGCVKHWQPSLKMPVVKPTDHRIVQFSNKNTWCWSNQQQRPISISQRQNSARKVWGCRRYTHATLGAHALNIHTHKDCHSCHSDPATPVACLILSQAAKMLTRLMLNIPKTACRWQGRLHETVTHHYYSSPCCCRQHWSQHTTQLPDAVLLFAFISAPPVACT
jgi:hypothetical protein